VPRSPGESTIARAEHLTTIVYEILIVPRKLLYLWERSAMKALFTGGGPQPLSSAEPGYGESAPIARGHTGVSGVIWMQDTR
jgi:hypothetical protein